MHRISEYGFPLGGGDFQDSKINQGIRDFFFSHPPSLPTTRHLSLVMPFCVCVPPPSQTQAPPLSFSTAESSWAIHPHGNGKAPSVRTTTGLIQGGGALSTEQWLHCWWLIVLGGAGLPKDRVLGRRVP